MGFAWSLSATESVFSPENPLTQETSGGGLVHMALWVLLGEGLTMFVCLFSEGRERK